MSHYNKFMSFNDLLPNKIGVAAKAPTRFDTRDDEQPEEE